MGRREDNKRQKRESLLAAGLTAMEHLGYDRASIEQIARDAGVARGTYYLYFPDKLDLLRALTLPWVEALLGLVAAIRADLAQADRGAALGIYQRLGIGVASIGVAHRRAILLALREARGRGEAGELLRAEERRLLAAITAMTADAAAAGLIRVDDPALTVRIIVGASERLLFDVLTGEEVGEPTAAAGAMVTLFTTAMGLSAD